MIKLVFFISTLISVIQVYAQSELNFNKRFVESEDRWVSFQPKDDGTYEYGFIYIDSEAGLTFNYEGSFVINDKGEFIPNKVDSVSLKIRLSPNNVLVAHIPTTKFVELEIDAIPEWLKFYKEGENTVEKLYSKGFLYNGWGLCDTALVFLEKAKKIDYTYKGLAVELAYSYNCLKQYTDAIKVLQQALAESPNDSYTNKELVYAYVMSNQLEEAKEACRHAADICTDKAFIQENYYNILFSYYSNKDVAGFTLWLEESQKYIKSNKIMKANLKIMKKQLGV